MEAVGGIRVGTFDEAVADDILVKFDYATKHNIYKHNI